MKRTAPDRGARPATRAPRADSPTRGAQLQLFSAPGAAQEMRVRVSARARRMSIRVFPYGRVEVVVPQRTRPRTVQSFVSRNRDWIDRTARELAGDLTRQDLLAPARIELAAIGRIWKIQYSSRGRDPTGVHELPGQLVVRGPDGQGEAGQTALRQWLAAKGREFLAPRLARLASHMKLDYKRVQIRNQRTRWGSCSASGTISLNCCLLFLSPELVRYLLVHELCHIRHLDHSPRYWALVERHQPNARTLDRRLADAWRDVPLWATPL